VALCCGATGGVDVFCNPGLGSDRPPPSRVDGWRGTERDGGNQTILSGACVGWPRPSARSPARPRHLSYPSIFSPLSAQQRLLVVAAGPCPRNLARLLLQPSCSRANRSIRRQTNTKRRGKAVPEQIHAWMARTTSSHRRPTCSPSTGSSRGRLVVAAAASSIARRPTSPGCTPSSAPCPT
jgi:hypothetical protein